MHVVGSKVRGETRRELEVRRVQRSRGATEAGDEAMEEVENVGPCGRADAITWSKVQVRRAAPAGDPFRFRGYSDPIPYKCLLSRAQMRERLSHVYGVVCLLRSVVKVSDYPNVHRGPLQTLAVQ